MYKNIIHWGNVSKCCDHISWWVERVALYKPGTTPTLGFQGLFNAKIDYSMVFHIDS